MIQLNYSMLCLLRRFINKINQYYKSQVTDGILPNPSLPVLFEPGSTFNKVWWFYDYWLRPWRSGSVCAYYI